ncbi:MAG: asparagine synthase (glutamine-hydrolyzing) [Dethiobacteria bacterium]|jgi:asparagine synthase (glutamine-hydrolysing)
MGGIAGILAYRGQPVKNTELEGLGEKLAHRGQEKSCFYDSAARLGLVQRFFSFVNGEDKRKKKIIKNEDESVFLIIDGWLESDRSLMIELRKRGHQFHQDIFEEVIVHLYEERGMDFLTSVRGFFSLAIWDKKERCLYGARDRFGTKPLYYYNGDRFLFASEVKAFLSLIPERSVNTKALAHYLTFQFVPDPLTIYKNIYSIPAGHYFILKEGELKIERYWSPKFKIVERPLPVLTAEIQEALQYAVKSALPPGETAFSFLSSGIDSTIVASLLCEQRPKVKTFSVGYAERDFSELGIARRTAQFLGTEHAEVIITAEHFLEKLPFLVWHFDQPLADPAAISLFFGAQEAGKHTSWIFSGEGADELFGGYRIYCEPISVRPFKRLPRWSRELCYRFSRILPEGVPGKNYIRRAYQELEERYVGNANIFSPELKEEILKIDEALPLPQEITGTYYKEAANYDEVTKMQYIDLHTWMPGDINMKVDKMYMANSLEARMPFLDPRVFSIAASLPLQAKIQGGMTKFALRCAFCKRIPEEIVSRPKLGFPVPTKQWMKKEFAPLMQKLLEGETAKRWINTELACRLLNEHKQERADHSRKLWTLLIFLLWHDLYISGKISKNTSLKL